MVGILLVLMVLEPNFGSSSLRGLRGPGTGVSRKRGPGCGPFALKPPCHPQVASRELNTVRTHSLSLSLSLYIHANTDRYICVFMYMYVCMPMYPEVQG